MGLPRTQWPRRAAGAPPRDQCAALRLPNFLVKARPARPGHCGGNHPGIASAKVDLRALDHQMGSSVGAIGVMQIMEETGTQMKVGDIQKLEPNIHAGVKYLRLVEDAYFDVAGLVPTERALLSVAAYNPGPNRIQALQQEAAKSALDPDRWFENVETWRPSGSGRRLSPPSRRSSGTTSPISRSGSPSGSAPLLGSPLTRGEPVTGTPGRRVRRAAGNSLIAGELALAVAGRGLKRRSSPGFKVERFSV